jgi:hypothetical protein
MKHKFEKIDYSDLNAKQQEQFNFQKVSGKLADYGYRTISLGDDWQGADFIANHINGNTWLKVQLKGRLTFDKKYVGKDLWVCFRDGDKWYFYPHDELLEDVLQQMKIGNTESWKDKGIYNWPSLSVKLKEMLTRYELL